MKFMLLCILIMFQGWEDSVVIYALDMTKSRRNIFLLSNILKLIRQIKPDIIHAQANKAVAIVASIQRFLLQKTVLIATLHNMKRNLRLLKGLTVSLVFQQG